MWKTQSSILDINGKLGQRKRSKSAGEQLFQEEE
jgi:hypothetical protein